MEQIIVTYGIPLAYIFLGVALLGTIVFPIIQMIKEPKKSLVTFAAIAGMVVIFFICYALSAYEPLTVGNSTATAGQMKIVEAGVFMAYILFAVALLAILYSSVSRYF
jgi:hypothetical protein